MQNEVIDPAVISEFLVFAAAVEGRRAQMLRWYDETHIPEILATHPFVLSVQRHDIDGTTAHPAAAEAQAFDSVAIYRVSRPAREAWDAIASGPRLGRGEDIDYASMRVLSVGE